MGWGLIASGWINHTAATSTLSERAKLAADGVTLPGCFNLEILRVPHNVMDCAVLQPAGAHADVQFYPPAAADSTSTSSI